MHISHTKVGKERIHVLYGFHFFIPVFIPSRVHPRGLAKIFFSRNDGHLLPSLTYKFSIQEHSGVPLLLLPSLSVGHRTTLPGTPLQKPAAPAIPALPLYHAKVLRNVVCV